MNFPYETEKSYLYGGNCLIMEVNPSVPNKPISKKSRIFASDYQYMETDIITVSDFEMRPVDYMLARSIEHAKAKQQKCMLSPWEVRVPRQVTCNYVINIGNIAFKAVKILIKIE